LKNLFPLQGGEETFDKGIFGCMSLPTYYDKNAKFQTSGDPMITGVLQHPDGFDDLLFAVTAMAALKPTSVSHCPGCSKSANRRCSVCSSQ
jgi:hypothetical protein